MQVKINMMNICKIDYIQQMINNGYNSYYYWIKWLIKSDH